MLGFTFEVKMNRKKKLFKLFKWKEDHSTSSWKVDSSIYTFLLLFLPWQFLSHSWKDDIEGGGAPVWSVIFLLCL